MIDCYVVILSTKKLYYSCAHFNINSIELDQILFNIQSLHSCLELYISAFSMHEIHAQTICLDSYCEGHRIKVTESIFYWQANVKFCIVCWALLAVVIPSFMVTIKTVCICMFADTI